MQLTLLGTGNIASSLGNAFFTSGHKIAQIYGRNKSAARQLALHLNAEPVTEIADLKKGSDIYMLCVSDDAIAEVADKIMIADFLCLHTSGAVSIDILQNKFNECGVFYPVQTITSSRKLNFKEIPICIEANTNEAQIKIKSLAQSISNNVHHVNSQQRVYLHLAAVFANNFSNSLYTGAAALLQEQNLSIRLLHPLMIETALKAIELNPLTAQTGPAVRDDKHTIEKHLSLLESHPGLKTVYQLMTDLIQQQKIK